MAGAIPLGFDPEEDEPLADFGDDERMAAAEDLTSVGDDIRAELDESGDNVPTSGTASVVDPQQGALGASGPHTPAAAGSNPAPATEYPPVPQFTELGPPPPPPAFTGDPQKDVMIGADYQRQLVAHHAELTKRQTALAEHAAAVGAMRGRKEAEVQAVEAERKKAEIDRAAKERAVWRAQIDAAVTARTEAAKDLEGFKWDRPHTGKEIVAIIFGGLAAGMQNAAAAQLGQAGTAQNEAVKGIRARMESDYKARQMKLKAAGDALLAARYGFKDAAENHRAAMNDIDAEFAAKYKTVAREAESQLRQAGVPAEQVKGNVIVVDALQKAAQHEGDIMNREEGHRDQREQAKATLALARANLGERRAEHEENREDRAAARAAAAAAKKDKQQDKEEREYVRDERGVPIGRVPEGRGGVQAFATRDADYARAEEKLQGLIEDIEKHGASVTDKAKAKRRAAKYKDAVIGVATVSPLGKTNEAQELEAASIGSSGTFDLHDPTGIVVGANLEAVKSKLHEIKTQRQRYRDQTLVPLEPGEAKAASRVSMPPPEKQSDLDAKAATLSDALRANPSDPRADRMRDWLTSHGYKVPTRKNKGR